MKTALADPGADGPAADEKERECKQLGYDIVEVSSGFVTLPADDPVRLVADVREAGLKAKPEGGSECGAGGATAGAELEAEGTCDPVVGGCGGRERTPGRVRARAPARGLLPEKG